MKRKIRIGIITILSLIFITSSLSKAFDIYSFARLISNFFKLLGLSQFMQSSANYFVSNTIAIFICSYELVIGLSLLKKRLAYISLIGCLILTLIFLLITAYNYFNIYEQISNCECFGKLLFFTPLQSFLKSITMLVMTAITMLLYVHPRHNILNNNIMKSKKSILLILMLGITPPIYSMLLMNILSYSVYVFGFASIVATILIYNIVSNCSKLFYAFRPHS